MRIMRRVMLDGLINMSKPITNDEVRLNKSERELQALAIFTHGLLTGLHVLGIVYNLRKRNWMDVVAHVGAAGYDLRATSKHIKALK